MAVNVSAARLVTGDLASTVAAALERAGSPPSARGRDHRDRGRRARRGGRRGDQPRARLGVRVAIDDFGMGHSA
jgi:EAL domain-containing protein (putative c-di-GMP-specific phosphodiesterase class I)